MGFLSNFFRGMGDTAEGGGGDTGSDRQDMSDQAPPVADTRQVSPWQRIVGMSQASGPGKAIMSGDAFRGGGGAAPTAGQVGARMTAENPMNQAWDRYMQTYGTTGQPVDPKDADLFQRIWK